MGLSASKPISQLANTPRPYIPRCWTGPSLPPIPMQGAPSTVPPFDCLAHAHLGKERPSREGATLEGRCDPVDPTLGPLPPAPRFPTQASQGSQLTGEHIFPYLGPPRGHRRQSPPLRPPRCATMAVEPTGQQTARSDAGAEPVIRLPPSKRPALPDQLMGRCKTNKSSQGRADAQRLVATRLLDRLHDPLGHFSRLQRIYPRAR